MRIAPMNKMKQSKLMVSYRSNEENLKQRFEYEPFLPSTYQQRASDLKERSYNREGLTTVLQTLNEKWHAPQETMANIERLQNPDSLVVIGGQQAGLLTGPLLSIHKVISIINLARQQEKQLGVPVIPVFWIAGEDHDFDEINHIMVKSESRMKKYKIPQKAYGKQSVSDLEVDKEQAVIWLDNIFAELTETEYTKKIYKETMNELEQSVTYVDFFARLVFRIFKEEGVVLFDSGAAEARKLESNYFQMMIENQPAISEGVYQSLQQSKMSGLPINLDAEQQDAHLFYHKHGERVLLNRKEDGKWVGKQNECAFETKELMEIAEQQPELLSNNVVTRPLMQELLFPTLAFIGGPGEISYWSVLKPAFEALELKIPPVVPRLSFTLVDRTVEKILGKYSLDIEKVIREGLEEEKINWLASQTAPPIDQLAVQVKQAVDKIHQPLRSVAKNMSDDLGELADKNLLYLFKDITFLEERLMQALKEKYASGMKDFETVQTSLYPEEDLQERTWSILPWLNEYGIDFIKELTIQNYEFQEEHYLIFL